MWYGISIRAGDPKPQPGSPKYIAHRRRIHILVVSAYLLYTIYEADWEIRRASDFYQDLGVAHGSTERDIKSRFRRLAAMYHPDKVSSTTPSSEGFFVHLKTAQDTLLDPAKRFAYDRFGPEIAAWRHCSSIRDYVTHGVQQVLPYYLIGAAFMWVLGFMGYLEWGKYWRWVMYAVFCTFELYTISRPFYPPIIAKLINPILITFTQHPPYLPFQALQLTRKLAITVYIAFSQIGPLLQSPEQARQGGNPEVMLKQALDRLEQNAVLADGETSRLMAMEMAPFAGDPAATKEVQDKVKEWLVQNTIRSDPEVRDAVGKVLRRRRVDAPAGARGNR